MNVRRARTLGLAGLLPAAMIVSAGYRPSTARAAQARASAVAVTTKAGGPLVIRTRSAEFDVLPSGYVQAFLLRNGARVTLDDPGKQGSASGGELTAGGQPVDDFVFDLAHARVSDAEGKLGRGKRVEITAASASRPSLRKTLTVEVYNDFPALAVTTAAYGNSGSSSLALGRVIANRHRLSASLADPQAPRYGMWSFEGSSYRWGKDDVFPLSPNFSQPNVMGTTVGRGEGGGIPVVAFWTAQAGEAIGHLETVPLVLSMPVKTDADGRVEAALAIDANTTLEPGGVFSTPRSFIAVYAGDFYEPLRLYSAALQREGWTLPKPSNEAYNVFWCGWGYEENVTPAEMLGTIPKLKEFGIHWATLDDQWFDVYGDWNPRPDTFPDDAIRRLVDDFHKQGIRTQIWWVPLAVEDGQGKRDAHPYQLSNVVREHPDWLILNKDGSHARIVRNLAALCPALPAVQEYYRQLATKFIRDWGFDGHKLDNVYTVPPCYNPAHHHHSPDDSIRAMGEVYKAIYETTRALKPDSVTQSCPCGTPPNLAWLPYLDQAVTADPVGSVQVRRRIKMYKALLGPESAVYGDHVELTKIEFPDRDDEIDEGQDFASTVGPGGVVGTKFVWPDPGPHFKTVFLTPEKEAWWKKWMTIYSSKMLSRGDFLDLYVTGYDVPEGYAIRKGGKMYYAFYAPDPAKPWHGQVELRGLKPGRYRVFDYENNRDLGAVEAPGAKLSAEFTDHLLLEVSRF